jgi:septal ring factor EnvC (AmiA/AmiB activator)
MSIKARRALARLALAIGALAAIATSSASAQNARNLTQVERDRRAEATRAVRLRAEAAEAQRERAALDARLVASGVRRAEAEAAALDAELRLAELERRAAGEDARQRRARQAYERAVVQAALASRRLEPMAVRRATLARIAARSFSSEERLGAAGVAEAQAYAAPIEQERRLLAEARAAISAERQELARLLAQRRLAEARLTREAAAAEQRAGVLAAEARSLRELAQRVQPASARRAAGRNVIPSSWSVPAQGRVVRGFGAQGAGGASQGALLRTTGRAQVLAPTRARVAYAGVFRSYGQVLILDVGGEYAVVLTGLGSISARVGEAVQGGQPIAEMPASDTTAPDLYVEVRRNGEPVDPGVWLSAARTPQVAG